MQIIKILKYKILRVCYEKKNLVLSVGGIFNSLSQ